MYILKYLSCLLENPLLILFNTLNYTITMSTKFLYLLPIFVIFLFIVSCNKSDTPLSPQSEGTGALRIKVHPRTELSDINSTDTLDYSGFLINVLGTPYSVTTDTSGILFLIGLPVDNYDIIFNKSGYSEYRLVKAAVTLGDTADYPVYMYKLTSAGISNTTYSLTTSQLVFNYDLNVNILRQYYIRLFFSKDSTVGSPLENYTFTEYELLLYVLDPFSNRNHNVDLVTLKANGFTSGQRVYFYANVGYKNQYYVDAITGRRIYNSLSSFPSPRYSFILP